MTTAEDLATIEYESRRIIALGRAAPEAVVPQYPTWTLRDLVIHVAAVHGRTAVICRTLPQDRIPTPALPAGADPFEWAEAQGGAMLEGLRTADPDLTVWTLVPDKRLSFWVRRMVIETGVHRWDAQGAADGPEPLLESVATGGLDEFPDMYLPRLGEVPTVELGATDLGRSWRFGPGAPAFRVEGTASDLFLRLMSRPGAPLPAAWEQAVDALGSPADP